MIKKLLALSITIAISATSSFAYAKGNSAAGKIKSASCAGCHGEDGNSMVSTFPKLAGQHASYLVNQLQAFKAGSRNAPMMAPLAMGLDPQSVQDIATFYSTQKITANSLPILDNDDDDDEDAPSPEENAQKLEALMALGSDLYRNGNLKSEVSACIACHGPYGGGNKFAAFPRLQGQHADYLIKALTDFKQGTRSNTADNMMHMIAKKMTDEEIKAVAYHISMMK